MILIKKGTEPRELLEFRSKPGATFDDFKNPGKEKLRISLLEEQGYICAYCMKKIHNDTFTKIEHYQKRNSTNQLLYTNLLAVCDGNEHHKGKYRKCDLTCDSFKGDAILTIDPCKILHINSIRYDFVSGKISSIVPQYDNDLIHVLNLNNPRLLDNRKAVLNQIRYQLKKISNQEQAKFKTYVEKMYTHYAKEVNHSAYAGIILAYLEKKLKKFNKCIR